MISTGLVEPGLFLRPRKFALISPPLALSSDWWGKATSCRPCPSEAQNTITFKDGSRATRANTGWSETLRDIETVCRCCCMTDFVMLAFAIATVSDIITFTNFCSTNLLFYTIKRAWFKLKSWTLSAVGQHNLYFTLTRRSRASIHIRTSPHIDGTVIARSAQISICRTGSQRPMHSTITVLLLY